ncbi:hypothetical protein [Clostridium lundense]|uniref:hypothetical protein n=1 Tax=Clostridium lundense TaxID=319475 RepID=UPI000684E5EF|nr:hypothetical protein [Clostridium lundense]
MALKDSITMGISKIAKTVGDGAATVAKKSGEIVEVSKLNLSISTEKDNIDKLYKTIGEIVYEKYKNGEIIDKDLEESCKSIVEANRNIEEIEEKITTIKDKKEETLDAECDIESDIDNESENKEE